MVIEVVYWKGSKLHAINQDEPNKTCCGSWLPAERTRLDYGDERMPTCLRCVQTVMSS